MSVVLKSFIATLVVAAGVALWYQRSKPADPLEDFVTWPPDAQTIRREIEADVKVGGAEGDKLRHDRFAKLFQDRFRSHDPQMAIGLRFLSSSTVKLMCPARMEPWNLDRVAMSAWGQTREVFGRSYDIDIYETFIGTAPRKIGELRPDTTNGSIQRIVYFAPKNRPKLRRLPVL